MDHPIPTLQRRFVAVLVLFACLGLSAQAPAPARDAAPPRTGDIAWLDRITFGADTAALQRLQNLGRKRFLEQQLTASAGPLPDQVKLQIDQLGAESVNASGRIGELMRLRKQIKASQDPKQKLALRKQLRQRGHALAAAAAQAQILRAIYSPNQLREQMVWFWSNHFSVFQRKSAVAWFIPDYIDHAIRPHALGHFRDLVMATLKSPAMLLYLDNIRNVRGKNNENYARELMELHVLGVHAGYTQQDVQAMMHILSGAGITPLARRLRFAGDAPGFVHDGAFLFNPRRHDEGTQVLLGKRIDAHGYRQIEQAVDWITRQPACARFVSGEMARYFVSDHPPQALIDRMAATFQRTNGDIAAVLRTLFTSPELLTSGDKYKDPMQFTVSAMRLTYDGRPIPDARRLVQALQLMGEPLYGRITPDGWSLSGSDWHSSGQMTQRFQIARLIGTGLATLPPKADREQRRDAVAQDIAGSTVYRVAIAPYLSANTRSVLSSARDPRLWNSYLLASPQFNQR
ncbi:DUF1800 domain-containing protein [Oleiagrimonas sp.]|jgi:uncharacterized protein (DUF1800 family)|uniref:DUF1800 domain-containing protein n=1 Tax=Oleiagrimonas sp. TaxID=2010330 RepID=UPI00263219FF|nr:DUF1800 domain-containing protein [Oleiagrimonas sp.]MDA3912812.1 DUF1800 domain-containing protein [Oleiagrimonas sp.]